MYTQDNEIIAKKFEVEDLIINTKYEDLPDDGIFTIENHEFPFDTFDLDARDFMKWDDFFQFISERSENNDHVLLYDLYKVADVQVPEMRVGC